jgi:uncharacterized glyoxalase superfamily protein PhnB
LTDHPGENDPTAPELFVPDVDEAVRFYTEVFGFMLQRAEKTGERSTFAIVRLGGTMIMFMHQAYYTGPKEELQSRGAGLDIRVMVPDVQAMYRRAKAAGLPLMHDIADRDYGLRDFIVRDPDGFRLRFASPLG